MNTQPSQPDELQESKEKGHEVRDANIPHVLLYGFGMLALVLLLGAVGSGLVYKSMGWFLHQAPATPQFQAGQSQLPPTPRLEVQGWRDLNQLRDAEERQLNSYGWVNRQQNIVRIPIAKAMELIAQHGLPAKPANSGASVQMREPRGIAVSPAKGAATTGGGTTGNRGNAVNTGNTKNSSAGISKQ